MAAGSRLLTIALLAQATGFQLPSNGSPLPWARRIPHPRAAAAAAVPMTKVLYDGQCMVRVQAYSFFKWHTVVAITSHET